MWFDISSAVVTDGAIIGWLVYGNQLFYSPKNNCAANPETAFMNEFMSCIIFVGYLLMAVYFIVIMSLPFIFMHVRGAQDEQANSG